MSNDKPYEYGSLEKIPELKGFGDKGRRLKDVEALCQRHEQLILSLQINLGEKEKEIEKFKEGYKWYQEDNEKLKTELEELRKNEQDPYGGLERIKYNEGHLMGLHGKDDKVFFLQGHDPNVDLVEDRIEELNEELDELRELKKDFQTKEKELKKKYNQEARKKHSLNRALESKFKELGIKVRLINKKTGLDEKKHIPFEVKHNKKTIAIISHKKGAFKICKTDAFEYFEGNFKVNGYDFSETTNEYLVVTPDTEIWKNDLQIKLVAENL